MPPLPRLRATLAAGLLLLPAACSADGAPRAATAIGTPPTPATAGVTVGGTPPRGPFRVGERTLALARGSRDLPVTVWYPRAASGRFPVVLFSHGLGGRPASYRPLLTRWAKAGFVVVAPAYPHTKAGSDVAAIDVLNQPLDAAYVLDKVLALDHAPGDPLRGRLDTRRVAAAGHSAGGMTTLGMFTLSRDPRLRAGIVLAGSSLGINLSYAGAATPLLFVHGQRDTVVSYASGRQTYRAVPWPKAMLTLPDGDHTGALRSAGGGQWSAVAATTLDFLRWALYGTRAARDRLDHTPHLDDELR